MERAMSQNIRVFVIESPSALDMLEGYSESETLTSLCRLLGHPFSAITVRSRLEFAAALKHLTSINPELIPKKTRVWPLCIHIAAHGGSDGLGFGPDNASWKYLAEKLASFARDIEHYPGPVLIVVSACCAKDQKITKHLEDLASSKNFRPPAYLFVTAGDNEGRVVWRDAVVAWSIFYHQIGEAMLEGKSQIKTIIDKIKLVGAGSLKYFRWDYDKGKYLPYRSTLDEHQKAG
jgi:hypothetical protein